MPPVARIEAGFEAGCGAWKFFAGGGLPENDSEVYPIGYAPHIAAAGKADRGRRFHHALAQAGGMGYVTG
jgi:hypothetical protein